MTALPVPSSPSPQEAGWTFELTQTGTTDAWVEENGRWLDVGNFWVENLCFFEPGCAVFLLGENERYETYHEEDLDSDACEDHIETYLFVIRYEIWYMFITVFW